jgi:hypothetical protein
MNNTLPSLYFRLKSYVNAECIVKIGAERGCTVLAGVFKGSGRGLVSITRNLARIGD